MLTYEEAVRILRQKEIHLSTRYGKLKLHAMEFNVADEIAELLQRQQEFIQKWCGEEKEWQETNGDYWRKRAEQAESYLATLQKQHDNDTIILKRWKNDLIKAESDLATSRKWARLWKESTKAYIGECELYETDVALDKDKIIRLKQKLNSVTDIKDSYFNLFLKHFNRAETAEARIKQISHELATERENLKHKEEVAQTWFEKCETAEARCGELEDALEESLSVMEIIGSIDAESRECYGNTQRVIKMIKQVLEGEKEDE
jgi:hypothetical protein